MTTDALVDAGKELKDGLIGLIDALSVLSAVAGIDIRAHDEQGILEETLRVLSQSQDIHRCSIFLVRGDYLVNAAGLGLEDILSGRGERQDSERQTLRFRIGEGLMGMAAATSTLQHAHDCRHDTRFRDAGENAPGSLICAPIVLHGEAIGVLNVSHPEAGAFNAWHERLLILLCNILAQLLGNVRLLRQMDEQIQSRTRDLSAALEETRLLKKRFEMLAQHDELTGLHNRRFFMPEARAALIRAARYGEKVSVALIDLDHFKAVNDTCGHTVGDDVLRDVAQLLQEKVRGGDLLARWGGEEFILLLPRTDARAARMFSERIRQDIERMLDGHAGLSVTASIGVASCDGGALNDPDGYLDVLISQSDQALYQCKRAGRNRVCHHHDLAGDQAQA